MPPEARHSEEVGPREGDPEHAPSLVLDKPLSAEATTRSERLGPIYVLAFLVAAGVAGLVAMQSGNGVAPPAERVQTQATTSLVSSDDPVSAINSENSDEQVDQGLAYYYGQGVAQNYSEAARLFGLAASQGNSLGQNYLAAMYESGLGVPQDYVEAVRLYQLAANQGNSSAQANLRRLAPPPTAAVPLVPPQAGLNEGDCIDISIAQGMGAGDRCRAQIAARAQVPGSTDSSGNTTTPNCSIGFLGVWTCR